MSARWVVKIKPTPMSDNWLYLDSAERLWEELVAGDDYNWDVELVWITDEEWQALPEHFGW